MKIAIDGRFYGLEHAGLGRYTINLIKELQKLDDKNRYYILLRKKYFKTLKFSGKWEKVLLDSPHYTIREQVMLPKVLKKIQPDLYHALQINFPIFHKGNSIVTLHDLTQLSYSKKATTLPTLLYFLKHFAVKFVVKKALERSKKIIVPSKAVGRDLIDIHNIEKSKLKVIYEGISINDTFQDMGLPKHLKFENNYFLYIGNAYPHKNLNRLIDAVIELNKRREDKTLLIIGGSRDIFKAKLKKYVLENNNEQYIRTVGYVPDEYMKKVYEKSIGFVYPSLAEGFGLQGLEAMRSGTLLLASDIPVFKEIYKDNAIYFNPYDYLKIVEALEEAITVKHDERAIRITKAMKFSQKYSWKKMAQNTLDVYKSA